MDELGRVREVSSGAKGTVVSRSGNNLEVLWDDASQQIVEYDSPSYVTWLTS